MSTKILDQIEKNHKGAFAQIQEWLDNNKITQATYAEMVANNETIADTLSNAYCNGLNLIQKGVLNDLSQILQFKKKPTSNDDAFAVMRKMVLEGSENSLIRKTASDLAEKASADYSIPVLIPEVNRLYDKLPITDDPINTAAFINHCGIVAKEIFNFVRSKSIYVADPPDDYYQLPFDTLGIMDLKGDCDDLALLLCSLYRSIGYRTFLGFLPKHVFAGVILADVIYNEKMKAKTIQYLAIPADPQIEDFHIEVLGQRKSIDYFDLVLNSKLIKELTQQTNKNKKTETPKMQPLEMAIVTNKATIQYLNQANIFFVDEPMPGTSNLSQQLLEALALERGSI